MQSDSLEDYKMRIENCISIKLPFHKEDQERAI